MHHHPTSPQTDRAATGKERHHYDAAIIGAGPAGATAARLLAQWGLSVVILTAPPAKRPALAECLPPSNRKVFQFLEIEEAIQGAGFLRTTGNTVWWGKSGRRVEPYPQGWGYQVLRSDFDRMLLELARSAGARVEVGKAAGFLGTNGPRIEFQSEGKLVAIRSRFILDCSGRAGVLARALRAREKHSRTVALCGVWRSEQGWKLPDASHTLVEAYSDGWAWSVPVSPNVRYVAFMVGPGETRMVRGKGLEVAYRAELAKTRAFRRIFSRGALDKAPWGCDASQYSSKHFCGPGFLLAGDAGAFIDPLSSFGVKKAMVSAWTGAVLANTCLRKPSMQTAALQFFEEREHRVYADYRKQTAEWFRQGSEQEAHPFWAHRASVGQDTAGDPSAVRKALQDLKRKRGLRLRRAPAVRIEQRPAIEGREIVLRDALAAPGLPAALDYLQNVNLARLAEMAEHHSQVPDLFEAYNRACPKVSLPNFLTALATLVAKKILLDT